MKINIYILSQYLDGELNAEQTAYVELALQQDKNLAAELALLRQINAVAQNQDMAHSTDSAWDSFENKLNRKPVKFFTWQKIAAAVLLLFVSILGIYQFNSTTQLSANNQTLIHELPDGSEVIMHPHSSLSFSARNFKDNRQLKMKGDILFRVKTDLQHPFQIKTALANVLVTGTKFRVLSSEKRTYLSLYSGNLIVQSKSKSLAVKPGESILCNKESMTKTEQQLADITSNLFSLNFEDVQFSEIIKNIERIFDVSVSYPNALKNQKFTIKAEGLSLKEILEVLSELSNTSFTINGKYVELNS